MSYGDKSNEALLLEYGFAGWLSQHDLVTVNLEKQGQLHPMQLSLKPIAHDAIKKINEENKITIVWSSHDLEAVEQYATKVACIDKKLFFHGQKEKFFNDKELLKTYTESSMQMHMHDHHHTH